MANSMDLNVVVEEVEEGSEDCENITFILSPDGQLKHLLIPETLLDALPVEVQDILEILGIDDLSNIKCRTLH